MKNFATLTALTLALVLTPMAFAGATLSERLDGAVLIGGAPVPSGTVKVALPESGNLATLTIDGVTYARVFRHALDRAPAGADVRFAYHEDKRGRRHLVGIVWTNAAGHREERLFTFASATAQVMIADSKF